MGDLAEGTGFGSRDSGFGKDATPESRNPSFQCAKRPGQSQASRMRNSLALVLWPLKLLYFRMTHACSVWLTYCRRGPKAEGIYRP